MKLSHQVFIVTHGDKHKGPNPGMTPEGFLQVAALRNLIPEHPARVVCGTGKRHLDVAKALSLDPDHVTPAVGGPESLEKINDRPMVLLADGTAFPREIYKTEDLGPAMEQVLRQLPSRSVICAGRPSMIALGHGMTDETAAVYKISVQDDDFIIMEMKPTGTAEQGTV